MEVLIKAAQLFLSLSILILLHEFGHFIFAKMFKTRVEKFYLFFNAGFSIFKIKRGETEYGLGWLPFGGYVKISGMIDESMDLEQMKKPPQPWEFRSKKAWQRLLIMLGGVLVNIILALALFVMILNIWGYTYLPNSEVKNGIMADSALIIMGFETGDKFVSLNDEKIVNFNDISKKLLLEKDIEYVMVERNGSLVRIDITDNERAIMLANQHPIFPRIPFEVAEVIDTLGAARAGIIKDDKLLGVNDSSMQFYDQFPYFLKEYINDTVNLLVARNNDTLSIPVKLSSTGKIGVIPKGLASHYDFVTIEYNLVEAIPAGIKMGFQNLKDYVKQFRLIFNKKTKGYKELGSFIRIGSIFPASWDWYAFWNLTAFLSIMLAFLNILPIPALDGGHVMFLLYEMITGRKPGDKFLEYAQYVGFILLLTLMVYALGNDINEFIIKKLFN